MPLKRKLTRRKIIRNPSQRNARDLIIQITHLNDVAKDFIKNEYIVEFAGGDPTLFTEFKEISKKLILKLKLINDRLIDSFD